MLLATDFLPLARRISVGACAHFELRTVVHVSSRSLYKIYLHNQQLLSTTNEDSFNTSTACIYLCILRSDFRCRHVPATIPEIKSRINFFKYLQSQNALRLGPIR